MITAREHARSHDPAGACWLCLNQVTWWAEAREKAGYGTEPPYPRPTRFDWRPRRYAPTGRLATREERRDMRDARDDNRALGL